MDNQRFLHEIMSKVDAKIHRALVQYSIGAGALPSFISALSNFTGDLIANARVGVRKNSTGSTYLRRRLNLIEGDNVTITIADDDANEEVDITIDADTGGGSPTYGQVSAYPATFSGDRISGESTTPFVDVSAFDVKEVLNSRILHLVTRGASKDQRVRVTLATTKAGAFDITVCLAVSGLYWSTRNDTYAEVRLSTSGDSQIAIARIYTDNLAGSTGYYGNQCEVRVGGSALASASANIEPVCPIGETITLRFVRDGSNVISFYCGFGTAPMALQQIVNGSVQPYTATVSGTLERIEIATHTPSGPTSTTQIECFVDYVASN